MAAQRVHESDPLPIWLAGTTIAMIAITMYLICVWVPMEATMGVVQRIFYIHVPAFFCAVLAFMIGGVASIQYLARREQRFDELSASANEVGFMFMVVNLTTGMLWARPIWGVYWAWDARLTTTLLLALIYFGYLILRNSVPEPTQRAVVCSVMSIFGMVDIPIVYMANQWWRTQHPSPVLSGDGSLDPRMRFVLYFSFFAFAMLMWCLIRLRRRVERLSTEADSLRRVVHSL